jgi:hypothetical protein
MNDAESSRDRPEKSFIALRTIIPLLCMLLGVLVGSQLLYRQPAPASTADQVIDLQALLHGISQPSRAGYAGPQTGLAPSPLEAVGELPQDAEARMVQPSSQQLELHHLPSNDLRIHF